MSKVQHKGVTSQIWWAMLAAFGAYFCMYGLRKPFTAATYPDGMLYGLEIKPKKGLTLIWPAEWTHAHKGNILHSGSKYIVTGWMDLCI